MYFFFIRLKAKLDVKGGPKQKRTKKKTKRNADGMFTIFI